MGNGKKPNLKMAKEVLPKALYQCITHVFKQKLFGCALVGGTALSGFYAGHRKSDDIDLFTEGKEAHQAATLAVKSLVNKGVKFQSESVSNQYFHVNCYYLDHSFTIDVVHDANLFEMGSFFTLSNGVHIVDLDTLLMLKCATLVSRCGEKDLYDLQWLFSEFSKLNIERILELGKKIDNGVSGENVLASLAGTKLRKEACNFSLNPEAPSQAVFKEVETLRKGLINELRSYLMNQPTLPLGKLVKKARQSF